MKDIKKNRIASFIIVSIVYALATVVGICAFRAIELDWWLSLLVADSLATVVTFIFSLIFKNSSLYDPYWSVQPPVILITFAVGKRLTALGILLIIAISYWAIRLTANWAYTFSDLSHQDWRYTMLKEKTGVFYPIINFVGIHMVPTLIVYGCVLPAVYAIREGLILNVGSTFFIILSICAATMQGVSDIQMHKFRSNRDAMFIRHGLWKYSRHPNYLGEILMWWGVGLSVVSADLSAWYLIIGALTNTLLFLFVSIPMADGRQSRKVGFEEYKKETRMLLPIKK